MPIYEYVCESCGHRFDMMQKMNADSVQPCESCGAQARRVISQTSFLLKGTGWYTTDYAGKKPHTSESDAPACASGGCNAGTCPNAS